MKQTEIMYKLLGVREEIYNYFDNIDDCQEYFYRDENEDKYAVYYTAMYQHTCNRQIILSWHHRIRSQVTP